MKVLTIKTPEGWEYEVHMLNIGEVFDGFGGSRHPYIAGRDFATGGKQKKPTASLIVRETSKMSMRDTSYDIHDPNVWAWIARLINGGDADSGVVATGGFDPVAKEA